MVRSMIAGVAGLKTHQSKLDTIGNNVANVNTWGFKSYSFNFKDSMYSTSINGSAGDVLGGGAGGRNASQVGYGTTLSSISTEFGTGAPSPSSNPLDCMIDGTGFFLVGNMINGSFTNVADSGLYLSRVGIFRVDSNGYLVDDQRSYVYGYGLVDGTGIPEKPATKSAWNVTGTPATITQDAATGDWSITIAGISVRTANKDNQVDAVRDWISAVTQKGGAFEKLNVDMANYDGFTAADPTNGTVNLTIMAKQSGDSSAWDNVLDEGTGITDENGAQIATITWGLDADGNQITPNQTVIGADRVPGVEAEYDEELSAIRIPIDPDTGTRYDIRSYKINEDGTIVGVDAQNRSIAIGQLAIVQVENPNGLDKNDGYYYTPGSNAGRIEAIKANGGSSGRIMGGYLEMANVDLANEFSQMITTQRGFQANSKIITVTDQMLEELVNMKR